MTDLLYGLFAAAMYSGVGIVLLFTGFLMVDFITPGRLRDQIWVDRSRNAASYVASTLLGIGAIVVTAIAVSDSGLDGLLSTVVFGLAGTVLMAGAFWVLDMLTPGRLGLMIVDPKPHPAVWVSCAGNIAIAAIVCASMIP